VYFLLGGGLTLCAIGFVWQNANWALGSVLFFCLAGAAVCLRPRRLVLRLAENGIEVEGRKGAILYSDIQAAKARKRPADWTVAGPRHYAIQLIHRGGVLSIPKHLNVPSDELFHFVIQHLSGSGSREAAPVLVDYLDRMVDRYGIDKVLSCRARTYLGQDPSCKRLLFICLALALTGGAWIVIGRHTPGDTVWAPLGILLAIVGVIFAAIFGMTARISRVPTKFRNASMVIAPPGLAMVQGEVQGEMRWTELKGVEWSTRQANVTSSTNTLPGGILLKFAGAHIVIGDLYDRPLTVIYRTILEYWREEKELDAAAQRKLGE
jgi:hypothetical protein